MLHVVARVHVVMLTAAILLVPVHRLAPGGVHERIA
jgi:hypothetical protein